MQRPFVFLATPDPEFERLAIDAILTTRRGVRRARTLEAACDSLAEGAHHLALAVVDVTRHGFGEKLLAVLNGLRADFPVLAIVDEDVDLPEEIAAWGGLVFATLAKADAPANLVPHLRDLCAAQALCAA